MQMAQDLLSICLKKQKKITCAESCTGGLMAALMTEISGASDIFERGFLAYSNQAKIDILNVNSETLKKFGAVSRETVAEMAFGALRTIKNSSSSIAVAITGIAGPNGGTAEKPVGMVFIGFAYEQNLVVKNYDFVGNRSEVRNLSVSAAIRGLLEIMERF